MIVARHVEGTIGKMRAYVRIFLLVFYLVVPWLTWGDRPAVLLDIADRKFYFPGIVIWPQEFYFLLTLLLILGISLFFFTALFGRLWCGWACPQTVYTELFDTVGRWIFPSKYGKRSAEWYHKFTVHVVWILLSVFITFHFIAYFVGAREILSSMAEYGFAVFGEFAWPYFLVVITGIFYLDLGFFRENTCVYICPYARFQAVMLDRDSIVIAYDSHRGEPRRQKKNQISAAGATTTATSAEQSPGDCTACNMCVQVCPTGIDIREGLQVACINCGHCIDACTKEMGKYEKETLVGYASLSYFEERKETKVLRPRTVLYGAIFSLVIIAFITLLQIRVPIHLSVLRDRNLMPVVTGEYVQNYYRVDVGNLREQSADLIVEARVLGDSPFTEFEEISGIRELTVDANNLRDVRVVLRGKLDPDQELTTRNQRVEFIVRDRSDPDMRVRRQSMFTIPEA